MKPFISVVVPVHNEEGSLENLHAELRAVMDRFGKPYELIYVDDGSTDGTAAVLATLTGSVIVSLARNYGQSTALDAGFRTAQGDIIATLDADCQNDPNDIPKLLEELTDPDVDVATGWRVERKDPRAVRIMTRVGRILRGKVIGDTIHDSGCTLRVYRREAIENVELFGEMHRYLLALLIWKGFKVVEVPVAHRPRLTGTSKYGYGKAVRGLIDLVYIWFLYRYAERPLHLFGYMGLTSFALGVVSLIIKVYDKFALGIHVNRDGWFYLTIFFLIVGIMLFSFGLITDLLMRIHADTSAGKHRYRVRKTYTA
jgi:glycosyltransferase involved in cell wall biosynthesis